MKPDADAEDILTGEEAVERMTETWQDIGQGKVEIESVGTWLIVRRAGGDYSTFLSLVDGTAVTILDSDATSRHIPEDLRPEEDVPEDDHQMVADAFKNAGGGSYPLPDEGVFAMSFREDGERKRLEVGLTDDTLEVTDDE